MEIIDKVYKYTLYNYKIAAITCDCAMMIFWEQKTEIDCFLFVQYIIDFSMRPISIYFDATISLHTQSITLPPSFTV